MRLRCAFYVFLFPLLTQVACPQTKSPNAYRSTARGLTVGELFGVAESAEQGDAESQLLMGLSLQLVAERIEYDVEGRRHASAVSPLVSRGGGNELCSRSVLPCSNGFEALGELR